ncbi:MAG: lipopolysaccharide heptosyltransferase II [Phycisphaerales bacterium]|nr:lipopolysaccharide heptosyltransferase II [Phycisphaerales bacterium]
MRDLSKITFERILLVKPSSLGDVVHALPALHGLRMRYPAARIDWLIAPPFAPLVDGHPDLSEVVLFDRRQYGAIGRRLGATRDFLRFLRELRRRRYDLVIDLQGLFRSGFLARATGAPVRLGFRNGREGSPVFYTDLIEVPDPDAHAVDRNMLVAGRLGFAEARVHFDLALTPAERDDAKRLLSAAGIAPGLPVVAVFPGARWETKLWPGERFAAAVDQLVQAGLAVVLLGGREETDRCQFIGRRCARPVVNLVGRTTVRQLAAVIACCDVVFCQDSAPMHLAVALDRPLVCLTGPTNPARTGPYQRGADVVRLSLDCSPCYYRRLSQCPHGHKCMEELAVEQVVEAVLQRASAARTLISRAVTTDI